MFRRWWANVSLYGPGIEGLRLPYDQDIANERAAGLARLYGADRGEQDRETSEGARCPFVTAAGVRCHLSAGHKDAHDTLSLSTEPEVLKSKVRALHAPVDGVSDTEERSMNDGEKANEIYERMKADAAKLYELLHNRRNETFFWSDQAENGGAKILHEAGVLGSGISVQAHAAIRLRAAHIEQVDATKADASRKRTFGTTPPPEET